MTTTRTESDAETFACAWLSAWNAHDVDAITSHYAADVEYFSPFAMQLHDGRPLLGQQEVRAYVAGALERYPDLSLGPMVTVAVGVDSIAIVYWSINDLLAVETLVFDDDGLIVRAHCHYRAGAQSYP
jgi:hypothetical protein